MLLVLFVGLVLICGVCFGFGYAVGHRGAQEPAGVVQPAGGAPNPVQADASKPKPQASAAEAAKPVSGDAADLSASAETAANAAPGTEGSEAVGGSPSAQAANGSAVLGALNQAQPGTVAVGQTGAVMVQIAAVTNEEDADVLVSALRRRGYAVGAKRDAVDGMIHVRIGPFSSLPEADKWRQKLLSDGYNAIVQP
jgi:cell division septation protein DedD